jgi:hypothetical protein
MRRNNHLVRIWAKSTSLPTERAAELVPPSVAASGSIKRKPNEPSGISLPQQNVDFATVDKWVGVGVHTKGPSISKQCQQVDIHVEEGSHGSFNATYNWKALTDKSESRGNYPIAGSYKDDSINWKSSEPNGDATGILRDGVLIVKWRQPPLEGENWYVSEATANSGKSFAGSYKESASGSTFDLRTDGSARKSHAPSVRGIWLGDSNQVLIAWSDGWRDLLKKADGKIAKFAFAPGTGINDHPTNTGTLSKK